MSKEKRMGRLLLGGAIGVGIGLLFAPKSGKETRKELKVKLDDLASKVKSIDVEEVKEELLNKIDDLKAELKDLDKETVLEEAKKGVVKIKEKAEELVDLAVKKGTPVIEDAAKEVKASTIKTLESITAKLKKDEEKPKTKAKSTKKKSS